MTDGTGKSDGVWLRFMASDVTSASSSGTSAFKEVALDSGGIMNGCGKGCGKFWESCVGRAISGWNPGGKGIGCCG